MQLLLPVADPHEGARTLYLCHESAGNPRKHLGHAFSLPKVTSNEVLNVDNEFYQDEEYILEHPKGTFLKVFLQGTSELLHYAKYPVVSRIKNRKDVFFSQKDPDHELR